jgi:hypothetical protein
MLRLVDSILTVRRGRRSAHVAEPATTHHRTLDRAMLYPNRQSERNPIMAFQAEWRRRAIF